MKKTFSVLTCSMLSLVGLAAGVPDLSKARFTVGEGDNSYLLVMLPDHTSNKHPNNFLRKYHPAHPIFQ